MAIEIVDFPIKNGGSFHCYVSSPEGKPTNFTCYQPKPMHRQPASRPPAEVAPAAGIQAFHP